jgi:NAD(P)-dependent dehydrogenase (short-subunit alcohol dehydrogenase family)
VLLENRNAVLYGVGESLGGVVARAPAEAGAKVFLTARVVRLETQQHHRPGRHHPLTGTEMSLALWVRLWGVLGTPHFNIHVVRGT